MHPHIDLLSECVLWLAMALIVAVVSIAIIAFGIWSIGALFA